MTSHRSTLSSVYPQADASLQTPIARRAPSSGARPFNSGHRLPGLSASRAIVAMKIVAALLLCTPPIFCQLTLRNLTGTVKDRQHEPLRGAIVQVDNEETKNVISYITDRSGQYSFKRLEGETDYRVWSTYRGQRSRAKSLSKFDSHQNSTINLTIKSY